MEITSKISELETMNNDEFINEVIRDYKICFLSRQVSIQARKEVISGRAKFGIFGGGMEVPQVVLAKFFKKGDWRSGYYRDQTTMFSLGLCTIENYFAELYADATNDIFSGGRQMNSHFSTSNINNNGDWLNLTQKYNISADVSPTAGQMTRALGLAYASTCFRNIDEIHSSSHLSYNGNEVCFCTIGDASTSEGQFWETINAAAVLKTPLVVAIWDNGYGISVPTKLQTVKASISEALRGFSISNSENPHLESGIEIYNAKGWDYANLCSVFNQAVSKAREFHIPAVIHVDELTQPQGHSTSGSHERYKTPERISWEKNWDCLKKMKEWMMEQFNFAEEFFQNIEAELINEVSLAKEKSWQNYQNQFKPVKATILALSEKIIHPQPHIQSACNKILNEIHNCSNLNLKIILQNLSELLLLDLNNPIFNPYKILKEELYQHGLNLYAKNLYFEHPSKDLVHFNETPLSFPVETKYLNGFEILNIYFDDLFATNPLVCAFGEDVGLIGDVNQGFAGLQKKYGKHRITDTSIREQSIIGQAMGMAIRGLRPIAEIQYLDYLIYGLQTLCDDVSTLHFRSNGIQCCPLIVRTRGHRLEGIWHSGSPLGMLINATHGIRICVPRNMTQAIGMYNTLLKGNDPGIVIECLNGYRLKEALPEQRLLDYFIPLGHPEIVSQGDDITIVSYGSVLKLINEASEKLSILGISCEIIDVRTLLPFDVNYLILNSVKKTNRVLFIDEDLPSGACAYMFRQVVELQEAYKYLDTKPRCLTGSEHRPPYGDDGDYFSKPNMNIIIETVLEIMAE